MISGSKQDVRGVGVALIVYAVIFMLKLAVYLVTGVMAVLAEALHSFSDIIISGFLFLAARWSGKAADERHPFGYARVQNVAALVAATLFISFTSLRLYEQAIPSLFRPEPPSYQHLGLALGVLALSMVLTAFPLVALVKRRPRGAAARAQLMELGNDQLGLLAAFMGAALLTAGYPVADPLATIVVASIIALNAIGLFRENLCLLLGRSPGPEYVRNIERSVRAVPGVDGVHEIHAEYVGPDIVRAGLHIEVEPTLTVEAAERISREVHRRLEASIGCRYCLIHVDPAGVARAADGVGAEQPAKTPSTA